MVTVTRRHDFFQITPGSKAAAANLCPGDVILAIDGFGTESMTHADAQDRIKAAAHQLCLKIDRCSSTHSVGMGSVCQDNLNRDYKWFPLPGRSGSQKLEFPLAVCYRSHSGLLFPVVRPPSSR